RDKYLAETRQIEKELETSDFDVANLDELIEDALEISSRLHERWKLAGYNNKEQLQYLLLPDRIHYDRKNSKFRTPNVNSFFAAIASISEEIAAKQKGGNNIEIISPAWVSRTGFEPVTSSLSRKRSEPTELTALFEIWDLSIE